MKKINLKIISTRFIFIIIGMGIGLLIMAQLRTVPDRITNPATPVLSLRETRDILYKEQKQLSDEAEKLQQQNNELQTEIKSKSSSQANINNLDRHKALAGMTAVSGPGVAVVLNDSSSDSVSDESIVHAADLRDTINLLWSSGAEAVSLNDQRIVFTTAIDCIVNTILINNTKITAPFKIVAIGDTDRIRAALDSSLNLADIKTRARYNSLVFNTEYSSRLDLPAYKGSFILSTDIK